MKAISNYDSVKASNGGSGILDAGAYVCRIYQVSDHTEENKPYLAVSYDVYDQGTKSFLFSDDLADPERRWRHEFRFYVGSDFGLQRYKALVEAVEGTDENKGFKYSNVDGAEQTLAGKWVGLVIRHRLYTAQRGAHKGADRTALDLAGCVTCADAIAGSFDQRWLEDRDDRDARPEVPQVPQAQAQAASPDIYAEDIPF